MKVDRRVVAGVVVLVAGLLGPIAPVNANTPTISGSVTSENGPVDRGNAYFFRTCQDYANKAATAVATIDSGTYSALVPAGDYRVFLDISGGSATAADSWHAAAATCEAATVVTVAGSSNLNLIAAPLRTVTGTVRSSAGPMANAGVVVYRNCEQFYADEPSSVASAVTDANGVYSLKVPVGTYRVRILGKAPAWDNNFLGLVPSWHNAKIRCEDATDVVVNADATLDLVAPPTVRVTGGVSSFHGAVTQGEVRFYSRCADYAWDEYHGNSYRASAKALMENGVYTVQAAAGAYRVWVNPFGSDTSLASWHSGASACERAAEVVVSGDSTVPLTIRGIGNVTGTVRIGKAPVAQGSVAFYTDCEAARTGQQSAMTWFTGGSFTATVPDGSYVVKIGSTVARDSFHKAADGCVGATPVVVGGRTSLDLVGMSAAQSVKRPPKKLVRGKRVALARKTDRLIRVRWKSLTKRVCTVRKYKVRGLRKGTCRVSAETWTVLGLDTISRKFTIRVV